MLPAAHGATKGEAAPAPLEARHPPAPAERPPAEEPGAPNPGLPPTPDDEEPPFVEAEPPVLPDEPSPFEGSPESRVASPRRPEHPSARVP
nr:MAG: hypothetical protein DIU78_06875 [Pseudomonadota bacterium]